MATGSFTEGGFDPFYGLRVVAAAAVLWAYRREYADWIPLLCFAAGFRLWGRDRVAVFASALAVVSVLLVFGSQTPLYAAYRALPLGSVFRLPDRFTLLLSLALALGAARGFDRLLPSPSRAAPLRALAPALAAAGVLGAVLAWALSSGWLARPRAADHPWAGSGCTASAPPLDESDAPGSPSARRARRARARRLARGPPRRAARTRAVYVVAAAELGFAFESPFLHPARDAAHTFADATATRWRRLLGERPPPEPLAPGQLR
jgi:hypothetical protein